jgi:hypothetical protein
MSTGSPATTDGTATNTNMATQSTSHTPGTTKMLGVNSTKRVIAPDSTLWQGGTRTVRIAQRMLKGSILFAASILGSLV